ncbi:hypothetical protein G6F35_012978 [Rhizopus arrhizus]|nr:hypothetical protein G6F35_012978 [Rhizopus arrhizus]
MLPAEILQTIFSHLSYPECYKARSVCQQWKQEVEYYLYQSIKQHQQKLFIAIKGWKVVSLLPSYFDAENKVIEFLPPNEDPLEIALTTRVQLLFSEWKDYKNDLIRYEDLELDDLAQVIFHSTYNPSKEQLYEIPPPLEAFNNKIRRPLKTQDYTFTVSVYISHGYCLVLIQVSCLKKYMQIAIQH